MKNISYINFNESYPVNHWYIGGGAGIRTLAPVSRPTGFQDRTLQPLGYSSIVDPVGFEPTVNRLWAECFNQLS